MPGLRWLWAVAVGCVVAAGGGDRLRAAEPEDDAVFSGPQPGETLPAFKVRGVYGEDAGKEIDFVARAGDGPLVLVFVHERTRPTFGVARALVNYVRQRRGERSLRRADSPRGVDSVRGAEDVTLGVVWLTGDVSDTEKWLQLVRQYAGEDAPMGISLDGTEGPGAYGLNRNVALTIVVAKEGRVTSNFALVQPSVQADVPRVLEAIVQVAGGKVPEVETLAGEMRPAARPADEIPAELAALLRSLIRADADDEQVARAAKALEAHIEKHKDAGPQVGRIARRIIAGGRLESYGTPKAREHLKAWAEKYAPADRDAGGRGQPDRRAPKQDRQED